MPTDDISTQMALMSQKLDLLLKTVDGNHNETKILLADHEGRIRSLEKNTTELSARTTLLAMIQSAFTAVSSSIAALLGRI
jgi:hypothetical protein